MFPLHVLPMATARLPTFGSAAAWQRMTSEAFGVHDGQAHVRHAAQGHPLDRRRVTRVNRDAIVVWGRWRQDETIGEHHTRGRAPAALNLDDRARGLLDGGRDLIGNAGPCIGHASTVTKAPAIADQPDG